jgi:hypothetical protein
MAKGSLAWVIGQKTAYLLPLPLCPVKTQFGGLFDFIILGFLHAQSFTQMGFLGHERPIKQAPREFKKFNIFQLFQAISPEGCTYKRPCRKL